MKKEDNHKKSETRSNPTYVHHRTLSEKCSDFLTKWMGSWPFMFIFVLIFSSWIYTNVYLLIQYNLGNPWDPYPFILLNLALSTLAAIQAPIILMSQNRQGQIDRIRAEYDYAVNRKSEREIQNLRKQLNRIEGKIK
jgi:uncharacterized membrane protein